jgi:cytochrome c oxidase cbb3-type subunit 3/ubiquinol-cytochrome c reductase cytochrome c subunit
MRLQSLVDFVSLLVACIASGTLECSSQGELTAAERRGALLYGRMCAVCHGRTGDGYAADQAPALAHPAFLASATDDYLRVAISEGRAGTTMSAWGVTRGGPLFPDDVDVLVSFLRSWDYGPRAALDERPTAGDVGRGERIFARDCARCHGAAGVEGPFVHIGGGDFLGRAGNGFLRYAIAAGRPGTPMPAFGAALGNTGVDDVIALLRSWQSRPVEASHALPAPPPPLPLGPVPLNPKGPEPVGFEVFPKTTRADVVKGQLDRGARMALLDARAPSDYMREHIAGAVSVPFYAPEPYLAALPRNAWLVCYCACPHAESGQLAQKLEAKGFSKVTVLDEGLGLWRAKQYGTRGGLDP